MAQTRQHDGSAGDPDYGTIGATYSQYRRPDPRSAATITAALGDARSVLIECRRRRGFVRAARSRCYRGGTVGIDARDGPRTSPVALQSFWLDARLACSAWSFVGADVVDRLCTTYGAISTTACGTPVMVTCARARVHRIAAADRRPSIGNMLGRNRCSDGDAGE